jgi:hypothetical protein
MQHITSSLAGFNITYTLHVQATPGFLRATQGGAASRSLADVAN